MLKEQDRQKAVMKALVARLANGTPTKDGLPTMAATIYDTSGGTDAGTWATGNVSIHQAVPKDIPAPFIAVQDTSSKPWRTKTAPGDEMTVNFLIVSLYAGYQELQNIANALLVLLTASGLDLSADGLRVVELLPGDQVTTPLDGRVITRLIPVRIFVEETTNQDPLFGG